MAQLLKFKAVQLQLHSGQRTATSVFRNEGKNATPKSQLGRLENRLNCRDPTLRPQAHQFPSTLFQNPYLIQQGREQAEKSTFSALSLWMLPGHDICSSGWRLGLQPVLEVQIIVGAKNTFCPLIWAQRWPLHSDACLPAVIPASRSTAWHVAICSTWGYT